MHTTHASDIYGYTANVTNARHAARHPPLAHRDRDRGSGGDNSCLIGYTTPHPRRGGSTVHSMTWLIN